LPEGETPFYDIRPNTIGGRFWGISMAERMRFQRDASNTLLVAMMDGTLRAVYPPILKDRNDELDRAALRAWDPNVIIDSDNPERIKTLTYGGNFPQGMNMRGTFQQEMSRNSS